jgi:hypothetical protein
MRNAARLNDIFNGRFLGEPPLDHRVADPGPQKNIKVAPKAKPDCEWLHINL